MTALPAPGARSPPAEARAVPAGGLTEAGLAAIWRGRRFPVGALATRAGVPVRVIFPGRPGRGPGPDFRGALISGPSGVFLRGDVELHVRSSSFRAHGHHLDPAYANVVLHVVFEDDAGEDAPLSNGRTAPVVALAGWVAQRAGELRRWLEQPLLWREPCHDAVLRLGAGGVAAVLESEGDRRFEAKVERLRLAGAGAGGPEQALYEGLLEALGYGGNAPAMLMLARLLPWARLASLADGTAGLPEHRRALEALLIGSAGLLPSQRGHRGPVEDYVQGLERSFARRRLPSLAPGMWKLWGVRPENTPARRIAAAAALLSGLGAPSDLLAVAGARTSTQAAGPLLCAATGYWLTHHDPCAGPARLPPALVGRSRALEIVLNVLLPAACAGGDPSRSENARALYARLPRPAAYGATRFLEESIGSEGVRVPVNARRAQGLLGLHRDWCTQDGCGRCPLS